MTTQACRPAGWYPADRLWFGRYTMTITRPLTRRYAALVKTPDPTRTREELDRYVHADVAGLPDGELARERWILTMAVTRQDTPDPWMVARLARLRAEGRRRGREPGRRWPA
jgi:hypothetical protein